MNKIKTIEYYIANADTNTQMEYGRHTQTTWMYVRTYTLNRKKEGKTETVKQWERDKSQRNDTQKMYTNGMSEIKRMLDEPTTCWGTL